MFGDFSSKFPDCVIAVKMLTLILVPQKPGQFLAANHGSNFFRADLWSTRCIGVFML